MPEASEPISECAINLISTEGKRIIMGLRKPDIILGSAFDKLRTLWNLIRAPDFDPVVDPDTLSKIQPLLSQIALVKPYLAPACHSLEQGLSKTLKHISMIKEILPSVKDPEEVLEDHYEGKTHFLELAESIEDILDRLKELEGEEASFKADIAADFSLKAELEANLEEIRARIAISEPAV
ncbi:hypothetical protein L3X38_041925 [Prunus dulcis]|uniref:Uncharacterized protein n=1 Tax=Prunus dulcis TaxID=3755 RepID=A0AAD4UVM4_PRUDU|nr:hypothetical protein L3X38_041925 [Prunus dulcis]